eukprot:gene28755-35688_t
MLNHSIATILPTGVALLALVTFLGCPAPSDAARIALNGTENGTVKSLKVEETGNYPYGCYQHTRVYDGEKGLYLNSKQIDSDGDSETCSDESTCICERVSASPSNTPPDSESNGIALSLNFGRVLDHANGDANKDANGDANKD